MRVLVLGAGVVGTTSAWFLRRAGHEVTVIDRQGDAALETSFANGGQISVGHPEPWANPDAPAQILKWLGKEDAPLLFRLRADAQQWSWGLRFLLECLPSRTRTNTRDILSLALYSRAQLAQLRRDTGIEYDQQLRGILRFHTDPAEFERAAAAADDFRAYGLERVAKTAAECVAIEPALAGFADRIAGGVYTPDDESGDAHKFSRALAALAQEQGVRFRFGVAVKRIETLDGRVSGVVLYDADAGEARLTADVYVVALGSYSPLLLAPLGLTVPVYPLKGYSITAPLEPGDEAPHVSLTDEAAKLVYSRLGDRLRVAGTAELDGYNTDLNEVRCRAIVRRTFEVFPKAGRPECAAFWTGLRPATPSNVPLIGRTRYSNLYLNTGHGTLGWTLSCGSARALADIVSGREPEIDFRFLGVSRDPRRVVGPAAPRST